MILSKSCVYGLRAGLYLATVKKGSYVSISDMSKKLDISFHFLTKTLQQLTAIGLLESYKGPNGGVRLTDEGRKATLADIILAIDGDGLFTDCALGLPGCGSEKPCPMHDKWVVVREGMEAMLKNTGLTGMAERGKENKLRITADGRFVWE